MSNLASQNRHSLVVPAAVLATAAVASGIDSYRRNETFSFNNITVGQVYRGILYTVASAGLIQGALNMQSSTTSVEKIKAMVPLAIGGMSLYRAVDRKIVHSEELLKTYEKNLGELKVISGDLKTLASHREI